MKDNLLLEVVTDSLSALGIQKETLEKVPTLVRRAVVDLQREDIIPPRILEKQAIDFKREYRDANGNLSYNYIELPKDFRKLHELFIDDDQPPYIEVQHENYLERISNWNSLARKGYAVNREQRIFSFTHLNNDETDASRPVLAIFPYPEDDVNVRIKYFVDGTENSLRYIDETYYTLIVNTVESYLGLRDPQSIDATDMTRQWKNRKGKNIINSTMIRTRTNKLFGK